MADGDPPYDFRATHTLRQSPERIPTKQGPSSIQPDRQVWDAEDWRKAVEARDQILIEKVRELSQANRDIQDRDARLAALMNHSGETAKVTALTDQLAEKDRMLQELTEAHREAVSRLGSLEKKYKSLCSMFEMARSFMNQIEETLNI